MKKIIFTFLTIFLLVSCQKDSKNVSLTFKIDNPTSDTLTLYNENQEIIKNFIVKEKGIFSDTLSVNTGIYFFSYNGEFGNMFLKNGQNLEIKLDTKQFDETLKFSGEGEKENNFIADYILQEEKFDFAGLMESEEVIFNIKINELKEEKIKKLDSSGLEEEFITIFKEKIESSFQSYAKQYEENKKMFASNGAMAYNFNYENYKGGTTKLSSLKGKYVYVDIWATWCGPCVQEIPFLQQIEEKYYGKNIEFVSISIDEQESKERWKAMVASRNMGGIQLLADKAWESEICKSLGVNGIPRFVLIDTEGKILNANAPRPSDPELVNVLNGLKL